MDFKEQKLKEFRKQFYQYWDSFDQTSTCERVESFLRKTLEEQEKDFENTMKVYHDNYYALEKRLRLNEEEVAKTTYNAFNSTRGIGGTVVPTHWTDLPKKEKYRWIRIAKSIIALQPKEL